MNRLALQGRDDELEPKEREGDGNDQDDGRDLNEESSFAGLVIVQEPPQERENDTGGGDDGLEQSGDGIDRLHVSGFIMLIGS